MTNAVICLNVLEHIEDDCLAIQNVARILKPNGVFILEVPAGPNLYDYYDRYLQHWRRYDMKQLIEMLHNNGFEIVKSTHLGFLVYPAFWGVKKLNRLKTLGEEQAKLKVSTQIKESNSYVMKFLFSLEKILGGLSSFPVGIRCFIVARKLTEITTP